MAVVQEVDPDNFRVVSKMVWNTISTIGGISAVVLTVWKSWSDCQSKRFRDEQEHCMEKLPHASDKYPAKLHNIKVRDLLLCDKKLGPEAKMAIFLSGECSQNMKYSDMQAKFKQDPYFYYLSGVNIPGCSLLYNFKDSKLVLFLPPVDKESILWSGRPESLEEAARLYDLDEVYYSDRILDYLDENIDNEYTIYTTDLDNVHDPAVAAKLSPGKKDFFKAINEARMVKDSFEIKMLTKACEVTSKAHLAVMSQLSSEANEVHLESEFIYHATRQGSRRIGYKPRCAAAKSCSIVHYDKNCHDISGNISLLMDAGAEWNNYTCRVARSFPNDGKFSNEHLIIYNIVRKIQISVFDKIQPGVHGEELHLLAHKLLIQKLKAIGIFRSEFNTDEVLQAEASMIFFPHGIGHLLGLGVYDVSSVEQHDTNSLYKHLRLHGPLKSGMVLAIEIGCYFNKFVLDNLASEKSKIIDMEIVAKFMHIGGVRLADTILVTENGYSNLTTLTSNPKEIESIIGTES